MALPGTNVTRLRPPPAHLGTEGSALWRSVTRDYEVNTDAQLAQLEVACGALDRMAECRAVIKTEGLTIEDRHGDKVAHPLLRVESACRAAFQSGMRALRLAPSTERGG
jgi:P27 family predicted phage terminase small subunit